MTIAERRAFDTVRLDYAAGAGPCPARNRALTEGDSEWVFLLDSDARPSPGCEEALSDAVLRFPDASVLVPRVVFADEPDRIHSEAGRCHFLGELCPENAHARTGDAAPASARPTAAKATSLLVRRAAALAAGGFDESLVFYQEDLDFVLRAAAAGGEIVSVPEAVVLHERGPRPHGDLREDRTYLRARNRWRVILKIFDWRTIMLTLPVQALYEAALLGGAAAERRGARHLAGLRDAFLGLPATFASRREFQARKTEGDRRLLGAPALAWTPDSLRRPGAAAAKALLDAGSRAWWRMILPFLR